MHRLVVAALALAACGTSNDDRPATLEYVTVAILQPSCGNAQCHSSFRRAEDYAFDTVEEARDSISTYQLLVPGDPDGSLIYQVLISPGGDGNIPRMPYDQPLADADVALIHDWIMAGAPGL
jgi:hypothetical protein